MVFEERVAARFEEKFLKPIEFERLWVFLAVVVVFIVLYKAYAELATQKFSFGGMILNPRESVYIELFLLLITLFLLPDEIENPSDLYNWLYYCFLLIPSAVLSACQGSNRYHLLLMFLALWLLILFRRVFEPVVCRQVVFNRVNFMILPYQSVAIFITIILIFLVIYVHGVFNFNFDLVYDFRFEITNNMPVALKYLMPLASGALVGYFAAQSLHRGEFLGILFIVVMGVLFFGFSSHKSMLFNPLVAISGYILLKMQRPHLLIMLGLSILAIVSLALPEDKNAMLGNLFINRTVFIPSQINFTYFDFFSAHPFMLWAESKVSMGLVATDLPMPVMYYIGELMTGNAAISANTGWVANAYMNAGIMGIVICASMIGFMFSAIDFWAKVYGKQLVGAAFLVPVITLMLSADLLIVLLTSGLFVLLMIFHLTTTKTYYAVTEH